MNRPQAPAVRPQAPTVRPEVSKGECGQVQRASKCAQGETSPEALKARQGPSIPQGERTLEPVYSTTVVPCLLRLVAGAGLVIGLAACGTSRGSLDNEPTLASLQGKRLSVQKENLAKVDAEKAIAAYRAFAAAAPDAPQRPEVLRRLGDLEMEKVEARIADGRSAGDKADWQGAVKQYQALLKEYPQEAGHDRVLYQLSRAHEQGGALELALATLDQLVTRFPQSTYLGEAQFRRGELLFTARQYPQAEEAYARVLTLADARTLHERALYMRGWSLFKQARLDEALGSFFSVLDRKLADADPAIVELAELKSLSRADRDLLEDSFRVTGLCLQSLQGADTIARHTQQPQRKGYEFRVYQQLAGLYLKQERFKDAADTLDAFTRHAPLHPHAPALQAGVIEIHEAAGFATLALAAKKDHVQRYGVGSEFQRRHPELWLEKAQPLVKTHLAELARHHHALAQKTQAADDVKEAVRWYRSLLDGFPQDQTAGANRFLLAELLHDDGRLDEAATEFEKTAYGSTPHPRAADAGYAAVLDRVELAKRASDTERVGLQRAAVAAQLRFVDGFKGDARVAPVLTHAAETLYALRDAEAVALAQRVLDLQQPAALPEQRRVALTVLAHASFEAGDYVSAESRYTALLVLVPAGDVARRDLVERQAASIYKQAEAARSAGRLGDAGRLFARVGDVAPDASVRAAAQFDAAATMMLAKDWAGAAAQLEDFRTRHARHPLAAEVAGKLAVVYSELLRWQAAAAEFESLARSSSDKAVALDAQWHAAELYERAAGAVPSASALRAYERFLLLGPVDLGRAVEARGRVLDAARAEGSATKTSSLAVELVRVEASGGAGRTARTRSLASSASLLLVTPLLDAYRSVALVEPLAKQLKLKKLRLEEVLKAYAQVSEYGVPEAVTAATLHTALLYQDFGQALMASQRPKKLNKAELEQYNVMLEEQAFPFEEKAIELHELNARRAVDGLYNSAVQQSFAALRKLRPVRWNKAERSDAGVAAGDAHGFNHAGVTRRQAGDFKAARLAYERALEIDPAYAPALLNLGILHDLYLGDAARAAELYASYLALTPAGDGAVTKWLAELKNRKPAQVAARKEP
jgi:cellulose synthase operon protein C